MTHEFKHPKYYTELRKLRNKSDQAISYDDSTESQGVRPGPGQQASSSKQQAIEETVPHNDIEEAASLKRQASSRKPQAPSDKPQAPSSKLQA